MSVSDLAEHLGLHGATVRYHLSPLVAQGLLRAVPGRRKGGRGRPPTTYRLDVGATIPGFPKRQYEMLAEIFFGILQSSLGHEAMSRTLRAVGFETGRAFGEGLVAADPTLADRVETYILAIAQAMRSQYGIDVEATMEGEDEGTLTEFSCPFEELALRHSDLICDYMDTGFYEGIATAFGEDATAEKLQCKGHGDEICQFRLLKRSS